MSKPPFIRVEAYATYSRVNSEKQYKYETVKTIGVDCRTAKLRIQDDYKDSYPIN